MNTDDPDRIIALIAATETLANAWQTMLASNTAGLDPAAVQTASADLDSPWSGGGVGDGMSTWSVKPWTMPPRCSKRPSVPPAGPVAPESRGV